MLRKANKTAREFLAGRPQRVIAVAPYDTVLQALKVMAENDMGAVLVTGGEG